MWGGGFREFWDYWESIINKALFLWPAIKLQILRPAKINFLSAPLGYWRSEECPRAVLGENLHPKHFAQI